MRKNEIDKPDDFLNIINEKRGSFLYHDHPNDGIDIFIDDILETMGWHSSSFDFIKYRDIADFIEENCDGTITFNDHPMGFNGFVEVDNIDDVRIKVKEFIIKEIKENPLDEYDEDQIEALKYFEIDMDM